MRIAPVAAVAAAFLTMTAANPFAAPLDPSNLEYTLGAYPTVATSGALYDELDYIRGVDVYLRHLPTVSLWGWFHGLEALGQDHVNSVAIWEERMNAATINLTGNTDSVYLVCFIDTHRDGPVVIEAPPGILGALDDHFFRWVIDIGVTGPDHGEGGKYLILPPGYDGDVPDGYHVARPTTYRSMWFGRGRLVNNEPGPAVEAFRGHTRVYRLADAENPPEMEFIDASGVPVNTLGGEGLRFYEQLGDVIEHEHPDALDAEERGLLASVGIFSGQAFEPDARMRGILERSGATGLGMARAITYDTREPAAFVYPDRHYLTPFVGGSYEFLRPDGSRNFEARSMFFYCATGITPAMATRRVGIGSQYLYTNVDGDGDYLDGAKTYRLHYPPNVPAESFWTATIYDPVTRSMLVTDQPFPSAGTHSNAVSNEDGSFDITFSPERPSSVPESNWVQTDPSKGWFVILRFYGPGETFLNQTWKPDDIVEADAGQGN